MKDWASLLLGFLQGVTEFLPVSSSGHLFLLEQFLKRDQTELSFVLMLHGATFLSILLVFFKDIKKSLFGGGKKADLLFFFKVFISLLPLVFVGLFLRAFVEQSFQKNIVALGFLSSGLLLFSLAFVKKQKKSLKDMTFMQAFLIGLAQSLAVLPGFSRSAWTIVAGLYSGLAPRSAVYYSFLISLPAIAGSLFIDLSSHSFQSSSEEAFGFSLSFLLSFLTAFASGWISLRLLLKLVQVEKLQIFSFYLLPLSLFVFFFF